MIALLPQSWRPGVGWGLGWEVWRRVSWGVGRGVLVVWAGEAETLSVAAF